ncbi:TPA: hypothetical protein RUZ21_003548 [Vibrio cholerae]|nr:hypothetical protein [Vibrio cholerae]HDZ9230798.1 hypothetical protein [Vibrio cholerae]
MVIPEGVKPLDRIWSLENWQKSLNRVQQVIQKKSSDEYQRFELVFDAGLPTPDLVEVERYRRDEEIEVIHLVPPPGIKSLSAKWWVENEDQARLFARRKVLIDESEYTPEQARKMFRILRENMEYLMGSNT